MRITPYSGTSLQRLIELLNRENAVSYVHGTDFTIGLPLGYTDSEGRNTRVLLTVKKPGKLTPQEVFYRRLNISVLNKLPAGYIKNVYVPKLPFTIHEILPNINEALGLDLTTSEVVNTSYSVRQSKYKLTIRETASLAWIGNFDFPVTFVKELISLPSVVVNRHLSGFKYTPPQESYDGGDVVARPFPTRQEEVIDLLNKVNAATVVLKPSDVTFALPQIDTTDASGQFNTRVNISAATNGNYRDSVEVFYHRVPLQELDGNLDVISEFAITPESLVAFVNDKALADIGLDELLPIQIPSWNVGDIIAIDLISKPDAFKWIGSKRINALMGLPREIDKLHIHVNYTLPSEGYIT